MTPLLDFYTNVGTDRAGRMFDDVMSMTDDALDASNDWVQWTFPLRGPCNLNPDAPAPTSPEIAFLKANPEAQTNLGRAFVRFLRYLGLCEEPDGTIAPGPIFAERYPAVWSRFNQNYLRVARFLKSLRVLGQGVWSLEMCRCLIRLAQGGRIERSFYTETYWINTQTEQGDYAPVKTLVDCLSKHGFSPTTEQEAENLIDGIVAENEQLRVTLTRLENNEENISPSFTIPISLPGIQQVKPELALKRFFLKHGFFPDTEAEAEEVINGIVAENMWLRTRLICSPHRS